MNVLETKFNSLIDIFKSILPEGDKVDSICIDINSISQITPFTEFTQTEPNFWLHDTETIQVYVVDFAILAIVPYFILQSTEGISLRWPLPLDK